MPDVYFNVSIWIKYTEKGGNHTSESGHIERYPSIWEGGREGKKRLHLGLGYYSVNVGTLQRTVGDCFYFHIGYIPTTRGRVSGQAGGVMIPRTSKIPLHLADSDVLTLHKPSPYHWQSRAILLYLGFFAYLKCMFYYLILSTAATLDAEESSG